MSSFQDSTVVYIQSSFFWVVTQCWSSAEDGINKLSQNISKKKFQHALRNNPEQ